MLTFLSFLAAVQEEWDAIVSRDRPQLKESGIEHLTIEFV